MIFQAKDLRFNLSRRVLLMGILNVTPDSFSERGLNFDPERALAAGLAMAAAGADIIDVGGESTRPGAAPVSAEEEARRVVPVIQALRARHEVPISVDTSKAAVAAAALAAGAQIVNDVSGFRQDPELIRVAAANGAGCVVMHMRGTPQTMQQFTEYQDLVGEINAYFRDTLAALQAAGIPAERVCLDPGLGFSKTAAQNLTLINRLDAFAGHGRPLLVGPSRKSFIGKVLDLEDPLERSWGTAAAVASAVLRGARLVRVHDVAPMRQVCDLALAIGAA